MIDPMSFYRELPAESGLRSWIERALHSLRNAVIEECALAAMDGGPCSCPTPCDEYSGYAGVRCPKGTADKIRSLKTHRTSTTGAK